jgi:hypothetical protein
VRIKAANLTGAIITQVKIELVTSPVVVSNIASFC